MRALRTDWFLGAIVAVVLLAVLWPALGISGGALHLDLVARYGVAIVFFLYGLTLAPEKLRAGLANWRLHLVVQSGTFLLFPAIVLIASAAMPGLFPPTVWTGFFYLAALPSTVSSSIALTSLARGNVPAAIFNASLSSLIGVIATPALMAWYAHASGGGIALGPVLTKILLLLVLPMVLGQLLHRPLRSWSERHGSRIKLADRLIILIIVFNSFSDSIADGVWAAQGWMLLIGIIIGCLLLFATVYLILSGVCRLLDFDREDRIAGVFCGSKKSLATGAPLAAILFGSGAATGLILTPLILFHFLQLVVVTMIASQASERMPARPAPAR